MKLREAVRMRDRTDGDGERVITSADYDTSVGGEENCVTCFDRLPSATFYPCRHHNVCMDCVRIIRPQRNCPTCRAHLDYVKEDGFDTWIWNDDPGPHQFQGHGTWDHFIVPVMTMGDQDFLIKIRPEYHHDRPLAWHPNGAVTRYDIALRQLCGYDGYTSPWFDGPIPSGRHIWSFVNNAGMEYG